MHGSYLSNHRLAIAIFCMSCNNISINPIHGASDKDLDQLQVTHVISLLFTFNHIIWDISCLKKQHTASIVHNFLPIVEVLSP